MELLDQFPPLKRTPEGELRIPIVARYKDMGAVCILGKIESGTIKTGDKLVMMPGKIQLTCLGLIIDDTEVLPWYDLRMRTCNLVRYGRAGRERGGQGQGLRRRGRAHGNGDFPFHQALQHHPRVHRTGSFLPVTFLNRLAGVGFGSVGAQTSDHRRLLGKGHLPSDSTCVW